MNYNQNQKITNNVWKLYGFHHNPFDTCALSPTLPTPLPIEKAFVPRPSSDKANKVLSNILGSPGGGRVVVEGEIGVGKTTFINYYRHICQLSKKEALFTPLSEISLYPQWGMKDFLLNILANLIDRLLQEKGELFVKKNKVFYEIFLLCRVFLQIDKNIQGSLGAGVLGLGGGYGEKTSLSLPNISEIQLFIYFRNIVNEIIGLGYRGVFLHLDNLEIPSRKNPEMTRELFENIRDILQLPNVYFIFVGHKGFFYQIISPLERVRSIFFGYPIWLQPLTLEQVFEVLHKRYQLLAIKENNFTPPVQNGLVEYLYNAYNGKIRFIMDAIHSLVYHVEITKIKPITLAKGKVFLRQIISEKIQNLLTNNEWKILQVCIKEQHFQNVKISKKTSISRQNIHRAFTRFLELNLIYPESRESNKVFYHICEELLILSPSTIADVKTKQILDTDSLKERQKAAIDFLKRKQSISVKEYIGLTKVSRSTAKRDLYELIEKGVLLRCGNTRNVHYVISPK